MNSTDYQKLQYHLQQISSLLYKDTPAEKLTSALQIETTVRERLLTDIAPTIGEFFFHQGKPPLSPQTRTKKLKTCLGIVRIKPNCANKLGIAKHQRISPLMEKCSLLVCANSSYIRAEEDLQILTGVELGHSTLHRQVEKSEIPEPKQGKMIHTVSAEVGKIKIRSRSGGEGEWRDYKAVSVDDGTCGAYFQENEKLQKWVNEKRRWSVINCLGDGHDGIWGLFEGIGTKDERREILDWYHLMENLHKLKLSKKKLKRLEEYLWRGMALEVVEELSKNDWEKGKNFLRYLEKHQDRIVEYELYQQLGIEIGSGAVESKVKQIGNRVKITGAQWKRENVAKILKLRCAYLNGAFNLSICA